MSVKISLKQTESLLDLFGGDDADITLSEMDGHSGPGLYAWFTDYPEEGSVLLDGENQ